MKCKGNVPKSKAEEEWRGGDKIWFSVGINCRDSRESLVGPGSPLIWSYCGSLSLNTPAM